MPHLARETIDGAIAAAFDPLRQPVPQQGQYGWLRMVEMDCTPVFPEWFLKLRAQADKAFSLPASTKGEV